jgi:hypothetical protein
MESSNLRLSYINDITDIRKKLWETAYSEFEYNNILARCVYGAFGKVEPDSVNRLSFKFDDSKIGLKIGIDLLKPISNIEMNSILSIAFENFVSEMYKLGKLTKTEYEICNTRTNMLFSLILNTETRAEVTL